MTSAASADRIKFCFLFCAVEADGPVDSFTQVYSRVILSPADSEEIKKLSRPLRERITGNEVKYRCETDWKGRPICTGANPFPTPIK